MHIIIIVTLSRKGGSVYDYNITTVVIITEFFKLSTCATIYILRYLYLKVHYLTAKEL